MLPFYFKDTKNRGLLQYLVTFRQEAHGFQGKSQILGRRVLDMINPLFIRETQRLK